MPLAAHSLLVIAGLLAAQRPLCLGPGQARGAADAPRARLALLVGVQHYAPGSPSSLVELEGCRADIESVRDTLRERFGFAPQDMHILLDAEATHEAIVRAWREWLLPRAGPQTEVVFWFSGHGARVPDRSGTKGAEIDGYDQTILAYDSRAAGEDGAYDISDDELYSLYALLAQKTTRLFAVVDACHSASGLRGMPQGALPRVRGADQGKQPLDTRLLHGFWPSIETDFIDEGPARRSIAPTYVHVAACAENQEALEYSWTDEGRVRHTQGALTFFLGQALARARPGATYRRIADEAAACLMRQVPGQTPCYEGDLDRCLFESRFEPAPEGILARLRADGRVALEAGTLVGLVRGSELRLQDATGKPVGRVQVEDLWATRAIAGWSGKPPAEVPDALRAFEETRPPGGPVFALFVDDARLVLQPHPDVLRVEALSPETYLLQRKGDALKLLAPGGIPIWSDAGGAKLAPETLAGELDQKWGQETRQRLLEQVTGGTLELAARFRPPTAAELAEYQSANKKRKVRAADVQRAAKAAAAVYEAHGRAGPGPDLALAMLEVENCSKEDLFLAVLSVMESHEVHVVAPYLSSEDLVLRHGETGAVPVDVQCAPNWTLARPLRDRYVVVGTLTRSNFLPFESSPTLRGPPGPLEMPAILRLGLEPRTTRGGGERVDTEKFGLAILDLLVRAP
jgi:Caspase domain